MTYPVTTTIAANANVDTWLPPDGRTVPDVPTYLANNAVFNVMDYGATGDGTTDDTAAFHVAMAAANAAGGGTVLVPNRTFTVSELDFDGLTNVMLVGTAPGFSYNNAKSVSNLRVTVGTWGIRLPQTSSYCGLINIGLVSNGLLSSTPPCPVTIAGVEYGVLIETGSTIMRQVTVYGFQYGCVIANGGNSNVFDTCAFVWNTKAGFAITPGTADAYTAYHPNLDAPASFIHNTVLTLRDCSIRRNGWGMIIRDGSLTMDGGNVIEANWFGGIALLVGLLDVGCSLQGHMYLENNFLLYDTTADYTVTQNNLWKDDVSTWLPWTTDDDTAKNDAGYQLYSMTTATKNSSTAGPGYVQLNKPVLVLGSSGATPNKGLYLKQASFWEIYDGACSGGDQTNAVRVGAAGWLVNACHFHDWNGTLPTLSGTGINRCAAFVRDRTASGGIRAVQGYFYHCADLLGDTWSTAPAITSSGEILTTGTGVRAMKQTGTAKVSHIGKGDDLFPIQNGKTMTFTVQSMILCTVYTGTSDGVLIVGTYHSDTLTALSPLPNSIVLSNSPTANQIGIFKATNSHVVSVIAGSTAAAALVNIGISVIGSTVTAVTDWA